MYLKLNKNDIEIKKIDNFGKKILNLFEATKEKGILYTETIKVNTFFEKDKINILILNEQNQIVEIYKNVEKNKIVKTNRDHKKTSILKLPSNTSKKIKVGSILVFKDEDIV